MKNIFFLFLFITRQAVSQSNINEYKYIDIPKKYDFLKSEDKYQLNSLTAFLFKKAGFNVLSSEENNLDDDKKDWCKILRVDVINNSGMFNTKLKIELTDCKNNVVFTSKEGRSNVKDYKEAYHEALREAFESIKALNYVYTPKEQESISKPIVKEEPVHDEKITLTTPIDTVVNENTLYAQPTANGYQLVDTTPKVIFILKKTSVQDVYLIIGKDGTVFYKDGQWIAEYYEGDELKREVLSIKF
jgi:hypothetical protein